MNKGVRLSTGDYILFLNSGDFLASPDVLGRAAEAAAAPDGAPDLLYGPILRFRPVPGHFRYQQPWMLPPEIASAVGSLGKFPVYGFPVSPALTFFSVFRGLLHHQGTFYARRLFEDFGLYDTSYRIAADFDFTAVDTEHMYICLFVNRGMTVEYSNVAYTYDGQAQGA